MQLSPTSDAILALKEEPFAEPLTARSLSDGTLRFAALTFAVFGTEGRQTLVVEELENGIHPARLRVALTRVSKEARALAGESPCSSEDPRTPGSVLIR